MTNEEIVVRSVLDFSFFINNIFSKSFENFTKGEYLNKTGVFLQDNQKTCRVSARDHFKSTSFYAHFMWELLKFAYVDFDREYHYFSFQVDMAGYHIGKIKDLIKLNPFYKSLKDLKGTAEGVMKYQWEGSKAFFTLEPHGMMSFKRGLHCNGGIYIDDPFQDPANKLDPKIIQRVNTIMKTQIMDIPIKGAFIHIAGTAQTNDDFFFDKKFLKRFEVRVLPAIQDYKNKICLWPEHMDWDELMARKDERGEKIFNQEYMCSPVYAENGFFMEDQVLEMCADIPNYPFNQPKDPKDHDIIGGWDLGKKRHPAHFCVYEIPDDPDKDWIQIHEHFFDHVDHTEQLEYIEEAIENFQIDFVYYDNTRGELEVLEEKGDLPSELVPVVFSLKKKSALATEWEKKRTNKTIKLINDEKQRKSILAVTNDLQAIETADGHGDAFFSTCLALNYLIQPKISIY